MPKAIIEVVTESTHHQPIGLVVIGRNEGECLRAVGWRIYRLNAEMALHDAAMLHWRQWLSVLMLVVVFWLGAPALLLRLTWVARHRCCARMYGMFRK